MTKKSPKKPRVDEIVWADGQNGIFRVYRIHLEDKTADLKLASGDGPIVKAIPWGALHHEDVNQAAARIVKQATGE